MRTAVDVVYEARDSLGIGVTCLTRDCIRRAFDIMRQKVKNAESRLYVSAAYLTSQVFVLSTLAIPV